jgi:hypothetical protein
MAANAALQALPPRLGRIVGVRSGFRLFVALIPHAGEDYDFRFAVLAKPGLNGRPHRPIEQDKLSQASLLVGILPLPGPHHAIPSAMGDATSQLFSLRDRQG